MGDDTMTRSELRYFIEASEMPASEIARLLDQLDTCPHFSDGRCSLVEHCCNEPVEEPDI